MPWYCKTQLGEIGPISSSKLKEMVSEGRIKPDTPVRNNTEGDWSPASKVKGLFTGLAPTNKLVAIVEPSIQPRQVIQSEPQKACPFCGESIFLVAIKCKHCGEFLDESKRPASTQGPSINVVQQHAPQPIQTVIQMMPQQKWSPGVAAVLSFVLPGLGQIYKGQLLNGILWMVLTVAGYICFIIPGVVLHLCSVIGAASGNPHK